MPKEPVPLDELPLEVLALERDMPGLSVERSSTWQRLRAAARKLADMIGAGARIARLTAIVIVGLLALAIGLVLLALFIALFILLSRAVGVLEAIACVGGIALVCALLPNRRGGAIVHAEGGAGFAPGDEFSNTRMILGTDFSPAGQDRHERYWNH
ncbi:hypothetical protein ABVV53_13845 [Novosphingobium sp. RD2P27]|uniref:Phage holin family protein n=1 Tax=Novosphingobium kalidii TaxID=3230299 RepID=A0ABV2D3U2_9SPHN